MDWGASASLFDSKADSSSMSNTSFEAIQRFFADNPVGSIGAKLIATSPRPEKVSHSSAAAIKCSQLSAMPHHVATNPSPPESIPSPCSSFNAPNSSRHQSHSDLSVPATHFKRKSSHSSSSSTVIKDRKEASHTENGEGRPLHYTGEHTREGSEPFSKSGFSETKAIKGMGKDKRKEQNRNAQRAFRERKEKRLKELQDQVDELMAKQEPLTAENEHLKELVNRLQTENQSLGVYKQAFTFTLANDLRRASMPLSKAFDPAAISQSSNKSPSSLVQPLDTHLSKDHHRELANGRASENRSGYSQPITTTSSDTYPANASNNKVAPIPLDLMHRANRVTRATRDSAGPCSETYTPPLSSSSLASFTAPGVSCNSSNGAHGYLINQLPSQPDPKSYNDSFSSSSYSANSLVSSSPMPQSIENFFEQFLNPGGYATSADELTAVKEVAKPVADPNSTANGTDLANWNAFLNYESNDASALSFLSNPSSSSNAFGTNSLGFHDLAPQTDLPTEKSSSAYPTEARLLAPLVANSFGQTNTSTGVPIHAGQWRSSESISTSAPSYERPTSGSQEIGTGYGGTKADDSTDSQKLFASFGKQFKPVIETPPPPPSALKPACGSFEKFVEKGVISNEEMNGLCEMLKSKATCREKSELMKGVVAVRPDWAPMIEDWTQKAKAKCEAENKLTG